MKSVKTPRHETIKAMAILGGTFCGSDDATKSGDLSLLVTLSQLLDKKNVFIVDETLKILVCTESNQLYIWYEDISQYVR